MSEADLRLAVERLVGKAMAAGGHKYVWPYQRIKVYNDLVDELLSLVRAWDNGRPVGYEETPSETSIALGGPSGAKDAKTDTR